MPNQSKPVQTQSDVELSHRKLFIVMAEIVFVLCAMIVHMLIQENHLTGFEFRALDDILKFVSVTILVSFLYRGTMKKLDDETRKRDLTELLDSKIDRMIKSHVHHGLDSFTDEFDYIDQLKSLKAGDELLWLDTFPMTSRDFRVELKAAVERGATIKMLLLDPNCQNAKNRASELSAFYRPERFVSDATECMKDLFALSKEVNGERGQGKLEIREYSGLPSAPIYIVCKNSSPVKATTSYFLSEPTDVNFPHLVWVRGRGEDLGNFLDHFHRYFRSKWEAAASSNGHTNKEQIDLLVDKLKESSSSHNTEPTPQSTVS